MEWVKEVLHFMCSLTRLSRIEFRTLIISGQSIFVLSVAGERSCSVVECLTRDRRAAGSSLTGVIAFWSLSKTFILAKYWLNPGRPVPV